MIRRTLSLVLLASQVLLCNALFVSLVAGHSEAIAFCLGLSILCLIAIPKSTLGGFGWTTRLYGNLFTIAAYAAAILAASWAALMLIVGSIDGNKELIGNAFNLLVITIAYSFGACVVRNLVLAIADFMQGRTVSTIPRREERVMPTETPLNDREIEELEAEFWSQQR